MRVTAQERKKNTSNEKQRKKTYIKDVISNQILKITALEYYDC